MPTTSDYHYDGAYPDFTLKKGLDEYSRYWPPDLIDLSSVWVGQIVKSDLIGKERARRWRKDEVDDLDFWRRVSKPTST